MKRLFKLIFLFILLGFTVGCVKNIDSLGFTKLFDNDESSLAEDYKKDLVINDYDDYSNSGDYVHTLHLLCGYNKKDHTLVDAEENYVSLNLLICNNSVDTLDTYDKFISFSNSLIEDKDYIIFECSGYGYIDNDYIYPTKIGYYDNKLYVLDDNYNVAFVINNYNFEKGSYYYYFNISDSVEHNSSNNNDNDGNSYLHTITITNTEHAYLSNNSTDKQQDYYLNEYSFTFTFTSESNSQIDNVTDLRSYLLDCSDASYTVNGDGTSTPHHYFEPSENNGIGYTDLITSLNKLKYDNHGHTFKYGFDSNSWYSVKFLNTTQVDTYYGIDYDFIIRDYTFNIVDNVTLVS